MYEAAAVYHPQPYNLPPETGAFLQFAADNADINVFTIDGHNTVYIMGIIQITPSGAIVAEQSIKKLSNMPSAKDIAALAHVPMQVYENYGVSRFKKILVENINYDDETTVSMLRKTDILWMYGKWSCRSEVPGWNGYIECLTKNDQNFCKSRILFLPFIDQPASNYNTIYTTLRCALENGKKYGHSTCIVTFDQPLYMKAREIVAASPETSELSGIILRLGGFPHVMLMSYLGSIGYIMDGSGIKEALKVIYAPNSVDKMLNGHAYARAIRAHTLLHLALSTIILKDMDIDDDAHENLRTSINDVMRSTATYDGIETLDDTLC
ncbi:hypothetical protein RF55_18320 [Lasius niger]|uniref:Uncharacterized protein n=1 Tax=Lasius niger TaxID=67767 RepID=A0A0J7MUI3_LASNI|nr:hypothetical protein RF55_18320 [Lasius niger]